jgi:hypothetical protein
LPSYWRHFEAPGVGHCFNGQGLYPSGIFDTLVKWVEQGEIPEKLDVDTSTWARTKGRILCPYPKKAVYDGKGWTDQPGSYSCQ